MSDVPVVFLEDFYHSLGILSSPQTFVKINVSANLCMYHGFNNNLQSRSLSLSVTRYFYRSMKSDWRIWAITYHKRFRNRPQSLRCDITVH
jgi:hypothetical protein